MQQLSAFPRVNGPCGGAGLGAQLSGEELEATMKELDTDGNGTARAWELLRG